MGFGSYDESEQEKQNFDQDDMDEVDEEEQIEDGYKGDVEFEMEDTESAIETLHQIKSDSEEEE